jgi:peptide/nickel transport system substrate-binding protein
VQVDILDPLMTPNLAATCEKARAGWPCDAELEKLRDAFIAANTPAEKKTAADAVQKRAMEIVTHIPLGEWVGVWAVRSNVEAPARTAPVTVFWGISKK